MTKAECDAWFVREVLPLEGVLTAYLRRNWRAGMEIEDLRQEIYARAYAAAERKRPERPKPFVMTIARNLLIDRSRREQVVSIDFVADLAAVENNADPGLEDRRMTARLELRRLQEILATLPPRCRQVVALRKIDGLSQREVAQRMGITEDTVERQVSKGLRILAEGLYADRAEPAHAPAVRRRLWS